MIEKYEVNINGDYPNCHKEEETIYHLFKNYELTFVFVPLLNFILSLFINENCDIIDWIEHT